MAEKVIHEVRFVETDDGFRIEVKGDKERMRRMGFVKSHPHRHEHHHRGWEPGCGPRFGFWRRWGWFDPWWECEEDDMEPEADEEPKPDAAPAV